MTIRPLFENTPVLDNNLNINALMTLTMMNKITRNVKWHKISNGTKCQMTQNVKWHKVSNDTKCQMTQNIKWHKMSNDTKFQMTRNDTWHMTHDKWQMRHDKWHMKLNFKLHITHMTHDTWYMTHEVWCMMHDTWRMMINDSRQKHPASHTSERTFVPRTAIFSSEGALIAITPYDYPQGRPLFEHTPVLNNNFHIMPWWLWWLWLQ